MQPPDTRALRTLMRGLRDLLLPRACAVCRALLPNPDGGASPDLVCVECWSHCAAFPAPWCDRCGHPRAAVMGALAACRWCVRLPPTVRAVRSVCRMDSGTGSAIVQALKYSGWRGVAAGMARRMAALRFPTDVERERAAIVPVPLAPSRERERGFNQSDLLARHVAHHWRLPVWDQLVRRSRATATQTRLSPAERAHNVAGAFSAAVHTPDVAHVARGAHVVLVDDVVTTAATLNEVTAALMERGVRQVSYLTFGRAPDAGDVAATAAPVT